MTRSKSKAFNKTNDTAKVEVIHNISDVLNEAGLDIDIKMFDKNIFNEFKKDDKIIKVNYDSEM